MTGLVILIIGFLAALVASVISISSRTHVDPVDPEMERRWIVRRLSGSPRLAAFVRRRLDRTYAGGLFLTIAFLIVLLLAVFAGVVLDMVDSEQGIAGYDSVVAEFGAANTDAMAAQIQQIFTHLGGGLVVAAVTIAAAIWGWWRYGTPHVALFMVTVVVGQAFLNTGLKLLVERDRPDLAQLTSFSGYSFPSGHAAAAAATYAGAALVLTLRSSARAKAAAAGAAAFLAGGVAASRALLGVHWLTDVIVGLAVGYAWFIISAVAFGGRIMTFGAPADAVAHRSRTAVDHEGPDAS